MVQDRAIFTMADQLKVAYGLSNGAIGYRVRVRVRVGKVRKPYPNFQMVPLSMTLSDR